MASRYSIDGGSFVRALARIRSSARARAIGTILGRIGAPAISIAILAAALFALRGADVRQVLAMVPRRPAFWLLVAMTYLTPIMSDWAIYRRTWKMPASGIVPLARKLIGNELVFGYFGDAYLFGWARQRLSVGPDALRHLKDAAILSAAASNASTILFAVTAIPMTLAAGVHLPFWAILGGGAIVVAPIAAALFLRKSIFSLPPGDLLYIFAAHLCRALATPLLLALVWHFAAPEIGFGVWWLFAAIKLVISRLPFMPNKDIVLAGVASALLGHNADVTVLLAMIATLFTLMHVSIGVALSLPDACTGVAKRWQTSRLSSRAISS